MPSTNHAVEPEVNLMKPEGVVVYANRVPSVSRLNPVTLVGNERSIQSVAEQEEHAEEAVRVLMDVGPDVIGWFCDCPGLYPGGTLSPANRYDKEFCDKLSRVAGVPFITGSLATAEALRTLNVSRIGLVHWGPKGVLHHDGPAPRNYFKEYGIEIMKIRGFSETFPSFRSARDFISRRMVETLVQEVDTDDIDGIILTGSGTPGAAFVNQLEARFEKPIVSINQATFWAILRKAGIQDSLQGFGKLLRDH